MHITDRGMTVDLEDEDPRAARIRALLYEQPAASNPVAALWQACNSQHREALLAIAEHGEIAQADLERVLGLDGVGLRGRHAGIAKIAKRVGVEYPIKSVGARREVRSFSLATSVAREVLKLSATNKKQRRNR